MSVVTSARSRWAAVLSAATLAFTGVITAAAHPASAWSGVDNKISYINYFSGEVWMQSLTGTGKQQITFRDPGRPGGGATKKCDPAFSPNGMDVAYAANDGGVYVLKAFDDNGQPLPESDINQAQRINVLEGTGWEALWLGSRRPTWSPDGLSIVFHLSVDSRKTYNLYRVTRPSLTAAFGKAEKITDLPSGDWAYFARYSPDGKHLAYTYKPKDTTNYRLRIMDAPVVPAPTPSVQVVSGHEVPAVAGTLPSWNKSGTRIAYAALPGDGVFSVPVRDAAGGWIRDATTGHIGGVPTKLTSVGGGGVNYSANEENKLTYGDGQRVYVLDLSKGGKGKDLGPGYMPGW